MNRAARTLVILGCVFATAAACGAAAPAQPPPTGPPAVTEPGKVGPLHVQGRFLADESGAPFFWLGDTAWSLPLNLDRDEVVEYLDTRAGQGYTVIQAVAIFPQAGGPGPNRQGDDPYRGSLDRLAVTDGNDPEDDEQYDYWDHLDYIVEEAAQRGIRIALFPVWSDDQVGSLLTERNAEAYGEFVGTRYGDRVIYVLGGDAGADDVEDIWRTLAGGIAAGAGSDVLMTYHPQGDQTSAEWFDGDDWLSFNMIQGGHCRRYDIRQKLVSSTFGASSDKPFLDGEPLYENHPWCWKPGDGYSGAVDVRSDAYWSVLGGAFGHTYGHHSVWQFLGTGGRPAELGARGGWEKALTAEAGGQMRYLRALMESRPYTLGAPADLVSDPGRGAGRIQANQASDGSYLMAYVPDAREFTIDLSGLAGPTARTWWFDPRTGTARRAGADGPAEERTVSPPDDGDWVFVADDAARAFPAPGTPVTAS
ncbi:MAG: glycoside hydrolase family 140 protein [Pseudonocardia sp.]|nr:glycoside hydrolase family 140 protein [Pseudonocardia sp.]